jgi:hypothetical protein
MSTDEGIDFVWDISQQSYPTFDEINKAHDALLASASWTAPLTKPQGQPLPLLRWYADYSKDRDNVDETEMMNPIIRRFILHLSGTQQTALKIWRASAKAKTTKLEEVHMQAIEAHIASSSDTNRRFRLHASLDDAMGDNEQDEAGQRFRNFIAMFIGNLPIAVPLPIHSKHHNGVILFEGRASWFERDVNTTRVGVGEYFLRKRSTSTTWMPQIALSWAIKEGSLEDVYKSITEKQERQPFLLAHEVVSEGVLAVDVGAIQVEALESEIIIQPFTSFHVVGDEMVLLPLEGNQGLALVRVLRTHVFTEEDGRCPKCSGETGQQKMDLKSYVSRSRITDVEVLRSMRKMREFERDSKMRRSALQKKEEEKIPQTLVVLFPPPDTATDAEIVAAGPGPGTESGWKPGFSGRLRPRVINRPLLGPVRVTERPDVMRYLDARIRMLLDSEASAAEWLVFLANHGVHGEWVNSFGLARYCGEFPPIPEATPETRIPFEEEVHYIMDQLSSSVLEKLRVYCWGKYESQPDQDTFGTLGMFYKILVWKIENHIQRTDISAQTKAIIRRELTAFQASPKTDMEWAYMFLSHSHGNCTNPYRTTSVSWILSLFLYAVGGTLLVRERIKLESAFRVHRFQRYPEQKEDKFVLECIDRSCIEAILRGTNEINSLLRNIHVSTSKQELSLLEAKCLMAVNGQYVNYTANYAISDAVRLSSSLELSNLGTFFHREKDIPKDIIGEITDMLGSNRLTVDRVSDAMLRRIQETRNLLNAKLSQLAQLHTKQGRRRARKEMHSMASIIKKAADAMDTGSSDDEEEEDEDEDARPKTRQRK